jgi:hypothetical protein
MQGVEKHRGSGGQFERGATTLQLGSCEEGERVGGEERSVSERRALGAPTTRRRGGGVCMTLPWFFSAAIDT